MNATGAAEPSERARTLVAPAHSAAAPGLAAAAAAALALALAISSGRYHPVALLLVSASGAAALTAGFAARRTGGTRADTTAAVAILAVAVGASVVRDALSRPGIAVDRAMLGGFRTIIVVVGGLLLSYAWRGMPRWAARARFPALVALATSLGAIVLLGSQEPPIDVWLVQQQGALALLAGRNPYTMLYPNMYGPGTPFLDPGVLTPDGRFLDAYPYLPLVLLAEAPSVVLGDVRWTLLASAAASAFLIRTLGRRALAAELAALLLLLQPHAWTVLQFAWTEPLVLALFLLVPLAARRSIERAERDPSCRDRNWLLPGIAAAAAVSAKQYVPLLALPLLFALPARARARAALVAAAGAIVLILPFLLASPAAFLHGVIEFQIRQPFRSDALSWPAAIVQLGGPKLPPWPAFLLAGTVVWAMLGRTASIAQALLVSASAWIVFVAFNKQAFSNYYWLGLGLVCAALAALTAPVAERPVEDVQPAADHAVSR